MELLPHRRLLRIALVLAALVVVAALLLQYALEPQRASRFLLARVGNALGLEITATGTASYSLRGTPMLVLRDVVAREPGAATPLLRAARVYVSVPWSTLRARGESLDATRIELDGPVLDLAALQHWLAGRPAGPTRMPSLSSGIRVRDGTVVGDDWRIEDIQASLPSFAPGVPSSLELGGTWREPPVEFDASGPLRWDAGTWSFASTLLTVRGPVDLDAHGELAFGESLVVRLRGDVAAWPDAWPALPEPLGSSASPLAFAIDYRGAPDITGIAALQLQRDATRLDARFRLREMMAWLDADGANPLPPIDGTLHAPRIEIAGAQLHGIEIDIDGRD